MKAALKTHNTGWIWTVVVADALTLAAIAFPSAVEQAASWVTSGSRIAGASIAPVAVLLLTSLVPSEAKAILVFWRLRDVLPGHRAFSVYAERDPRVDVDRLRAGVGTFPVVPRDQNAAWYRLFKKVDADPAVAQAHRHFLLFRDLAALSFLLLIAAPILLAVLGASAAMIGASAGVLTVQYFATAIAARFQGVRLVCNVLALHGAADTARPRRKGSKSK